MSENWGSYFRDIDGKPASILVDLDIANEPTARSHNHVVHVRLRMNSPRPDGLSSQEEFSTLSTIEDSFESGLGDKIGTFVGRITGGGYRDFYFYVRDPVFWSAHIRRSIQLFPGYDLELDSGEDREWRTYFDLLRPSPGERQTIKNRSVCDVLEQQGDDLTQPREVLHWAYFATAQARSAFVEQVLKQGFGLHGSSDPEKPGDLYGARFARVDTPSREGIDQITAPLADLAVQFGGEYDGWETQVIRRPREKKGFFRKLWPKTGQ